MAGEWIPYDVCLPMKPEILEIQDATGEGVDAIVGRLVQLWGWAALNVDGGVFRMTVPRLGRMFGGDATFWTAVQDAGWLEIDGEGGTVAIPGWERRFAQAAKTRALHARRASGARERTGECAQAHAPVRPSAPERGDRGKRNSSSSSAGVAAQPEGWETLREAWNTGAEAGNRRPWRLPTPPEKARDRLAEEGWFAQALEAIARIPRCRYFADPVTMLQLVKPGFVEKVLGGQYDSPKAPKGGTAGPAADGKPSAEEASARWHKRDEEAERRLAEYVKARQARSNA